MRPGVGGGCAASVVSIGVGSDGLTSPAAIATSQEESEDKEMKGVLGKEEERRGCF